MEKKTKDMQSTIISLEPITFDHALYTQEDIQSRIFTIRGVQVMLDLHLAQLYQVENRVLKQAVRRNESRFPDDFMLRLTKDEANELISIGVSQSVIPSGYNVGASDMFAFTEQGVTQLSAVLRSDVAIEMFIRIMRAFHAMRKFLMANAGILQRLDTIERHHLNTGYLVSFCFNKNKQLGVHEVCLDGKKLVECIV